ncbi:MAG: hypothetical protein ACE5JG_02790 [Planctomycetota bacterium]
MTTFAKIFVVVNLIFSLAVFGAGATLLGAQDDYKRALEDYQKDFEDYKKRTDGEKTALSDRLLEQQRVASDATASKTEAEALASEKSSALEEARRANAAQSSAYDKLSEQFKTLVATEEKRQSMIDKLTGDRDSSQRKYMDAMKQLETVIAERQRLEDELGKCMEERDALTSRGQDQAEKIRNLDFELTAYRTRFGPIAPGPQGPDGVKLPLVVLSIGSNDGVKIGDEYHISRGEKYVGQVRVTRVEKNAAVAQITDVKGSGYPPQANDKAYTR